MNDTPNPNQGALCDAEGCENVCERVCYAMGRRVLLCVGHASYVNHGIVPPLRPAQSSVPGSSHNA